MARVTPQEYADKLIRRGQAASQDYTKGVLAVTVSPTAEAAKKLDKAATNFQEAVSSGRMARRLNEVTLESWKKSASEKGGSRFGPGLAAARDKMVAFATGFLPFQDSIVQKAKAMPDYSLSDQIAKAVFVMTETAKYKDRR
jgi:hypothetical protein